MNFQWLFDRPIAHRGLWDAQTPENSLPAYQKAIDANYNIEIDVHLTKDGHLVVFHDTNLKRVCGVDMVIAKHTLEEIKQYGLSGTEHKIPTIEEFLALVDGKTGILLEIKGINPFNKSIVKATIKALENYNGPIALQSFNFGAVGYARRHCNLPVGELCTWASFDGKKPRFFLTNFMGKIWVCKFTKPDFVSYDVKAASAKLSENKYIKKWANKLPIIFWTVINEETMEDAKAQANNIIFEYLPLDYVEEQVGKFMEFKCPVEKLPCNHSK